MTVRQTILLVIGGTALIVIGIGLIYWPAALLVLGAAMLAAGLLVETKR